jgi:microcystin-dependent protein
MLAIENTTVVDGEVVGDDLHLQTREGTVIVAGNVRGPQGIQGPMGEVTDADLAAAMAETRVPAGTISMFAGDTAPVGWLMCDGAAVDRTIYADLFAALGLKYGLGNGTTTFNLPDIQSRFPVGKGAAVWSDTLNKKGGTKDLIVVSHNHSTPNHIHSASGSAGNDPQRQLDVRNMATNGYLYRFPALVTSGGNGAAGELGYDDGNAGFGGKYAAIMPAHSHTIGVTVNSGGASTTGSAGGSATDANLPPFITVNFIIKI